MYFSIFGQDSLNGNVVNEQGTKVVWNIESISLCQIKYRIVFDI